jgi:sugar phosphate isomerase/epimerase
LKHALFLAPTTLLHAAPLEYLRAALAAGYDGAGLRLHASPNFPFHPIAGNAALVREVKAVLAELPLLDIYSFYLRPETKISDFVPALALGAELGARYALVQGDDPDYRRLVENFARFCDAAAPLGLSAAVEFVPARHLATLPKALQLLREARRTNGCVLVDALHLARSGHPMVDLKMLDLPYAQISDGIPATGERRIPGEGELRLGEFLDALPAGIPLSVEVLPPKDATPGEWARRVIEGTRRFLATAASRPSA